MRGIHVTDRPSNAASAPWQSTASLVAGLASLVALVVFFILPSGPVPMLIAGLLGAVAVIFGIIGVRGSRTRGKAITGIVSGGFSLLFSAAIYLFALLFIGAIAI